MFIDKKTGFGNNKYTKIAKEGKRLFQNWRKLENYHPPVIILVVITA